MRQYCVNFSDVRSDDEGSRSSETVSYELLESHILLVNSTNHTKLSSNDSKTRGMSSVSPKLHNKS
jgi:hypothetical protein